MNLLDWLKDRLKTDYSPRGFLVRVLVDLFLSNLGLFFGILTTVLAYIINSHTASHDFFSEMFYKVWIVSVLPLSLCCIIAFTLNGFYRGIRTVSYVSRILIVSKGMLTAFCLFLLWIYIMKPLMPRIALIAGWISIFALILASRLFWTAFSKQYHIVSAAAEKKQIEKQARELALMSQQDGWLPPDGLPPNAAAWPYFAYDEVLAAAAVLKSGRINQWTGKEVENFQEEFAAFCGMRHAIALANGSIALDMALYTLNIGHGDEVIVTPRTFIASAGCVALRGAKPVFADVHPESQNITAESITRVITYKTRAIITVHLAGWPCDMDPILDIAERYHLKVIEDCAQSHGAIYYSCRPGRVSAGDQCLPIEKAGVRLYPRLTGSMGDMAAFSFCQDKIMTTGGEGGMLLTNDEALWEKAWAFKDHGKSYDAVYHRQHPAGFRWLHESFGINGRLTEMQAAIGRLQLTKLPEWVAIRRRNAMMLTKAFSRIQSLRVTTPQDNIRHSYYKYYVFVRPERLKEGWDRDRIMKAVIAAGAPCFSGSCSEVYLEKAFDGEGLRPAERLPVAKELGETSLMFLVHPTLTEKDMATVATIVSKVMSEAEK